MRRLLMFLPIVALAGLAGKAPLPPVAQAWWGGAACIGCDEPGGRAGTPEGPDTVMQAIGATELYPAKDGANVPALSLFARAVARVESLQAP